MKKFVSILIVSIMLAVTSGTVYSSSDIIEFTDEPGTAIGLTGDANGDNLVNLKDASLILKYIVKTNPEHAFIDLYYADANGDSKINLTDVSIILKKIAKWNKIEGYVIKQSKEIMFDKAIELYTTYMIENYNYNVDECGKFYVEFYFGTTIDGKVLIKVSNDITPSTEEEIHKQFVIVAKDLFMPFEQIPSDFNSIKRLFLHQYYEGVFLTRHDMYYEN